MSKAIFELGILIALACIATGITGCLWDMGNWSWLIFVAVLLLGAKIWASIPSPTSTSSPAPVVAGTAGSTTTPQQSKSQTYVAQNVAIVIVAAACMIAFIVLGCWAAKDIAGMGTGNYNQHPTANPWLAKASTGKPTQGPALPATIPVDERGVIMGFVLPEGREVTDLPFGTKVHLTTNGCGEWHYRIMTKDLEKAEKSYTKDNPPKKYFVQWRDLPPELDGETIAFLLIRTGWVEVRVDKECQIAGRIVSLGTDS